MANWGPENFWVSQLGDEALVKLARNQSTLQALSLGGCCNAGPDTVWNLSPRITVRQHDVMSWEDAVDQQRTRPPPRMNESLRTMRVHRGCKCTASPLRGCSVVRSPLANIEQARPSLAGDMVAI